MPLILNIRRLGRLACGLICGLMLAQAAGGATPAQREISVLTWPDYLDPELIAAFEAKTGYTLKLTYFESDETRDDFLIRNNGAGYDLILINDYTLQLYVERGWIDALNQTQVSSLRYIDPKWLAASKGQPQYGMPYFWGTLGIAYRDDLVSMPISRWMDIYDPAEELRGHLIMIKHSRDLIGMALLALGYSLNSTDSQQLEEARALMLKQKPSVSAYSYVSLGEDSALLDGSVVAAQVYSGDALMLQKLNPHIKYVAPEEGTNVWLDRWAVATQAKNKNGAYAFLNFINEPENAANNAEFVHYASPNLAANKLLPPSHFEDPVINPSQEVLQRGGSYKVLPPRVMRKWNAIFAEVIH